MFDIQFSDDEKGKEQDCNGVYRLRKLHEVPVNSQELFYERAYSMAGEKG